MVERVGGDFHASHFPIFERSSFKGDVGQNLFEHTSKFYAWYLSWVSTPSKEVQTFKKLSTIMQICQVSLKGGGYLTLQEEQSALKEMQTLGEDLSSGIQKTHQIDRTIGLIINRLTENNSKAKLVAQIVEIEYIINTQKNYPLSEEFKMILSSVLDKIKPELPDFNAEALFRGLSKLSEMGQYDKKGLAEMQELIKSWL